MYVFELEAAYLTSELKDESYKLLDKEMSIKDAVAFAEDFFMNKLPYETNPDIGIDIPEVHVYEVKDGFFHTATEDDYINIKFNEVAVDIGYEFRYKSGYELSGNHMFEDVILNEENENLHIKASLGETLNVDYYAGVFCNGELLNAFNGCKFIKFNTLNGTRVLDYIIDEEALPSKGTYAFQVVLIPSSEAIGINEIESYSTYKHRVIVS